MTTMIIVIGLIPALVLLLAFVIGRRALASRAAENDRLAEIVINFKRALADYANSGGENLSLIHI